MPQTLAPTDPILLEVQAALAGRYSVERELGRGGMATVYLARDIRLDRLVAIKVLLPELAVRPELRERFLRETRTAASFSHPNIVPVHAVEETPTLLFFVMGFVEGETLTQVVRRHGPLTATAAARLIQEVAWALSYAHGRGVVHRDVKPDNILLERATGRAMVTDFGIARSFAASGLTQVGEVVGTPHFMSPEQAAGDQLDGRSDLYSLGVASFFAVTGRVPFDGESAQAILAMHMSRPAPPILELRPDLPAPLGDTIDRCLAKEPQDRFSRGEELVDALEGIRAGRKEVPTSIRLWVTRSDQFFRVGLILTLLSSQVVGRFHSELEQLVSGTMFLVLVISLWIQIPLGMRDLARQGLDFGDLVAGLVDLDHERLAATAALRAAPDYNQRRRMRAVLLALSGIIAVLLLLFALSQKRPPPGHIFTPIGTVALVLGIAVGMGTLVFTVAGVARIGRMDRRMHGLWTGPVGRFLFWLGSLGLEQHGTGATPSAGPRAPLEDLPREQRHRSNRFRTLFDQIDRQLERLAQRDNELTETLDQVSGTTPTSGGGVAVKHQTLIRDLEQAQRGTSDRRLELLGALENARLGLLRLKSKV
ncbi:MAG TPA: serine/threonine-protein kinase, partial [Gemmatimonadales bacterium]|nr:serine/threonine-protein kinase [Gemmatimonadales bacterium]